MIPKPLMPAIAARRKNPDHPFIKWLASIGSSVREWAEEHFVSRQLVQRWTLPGPRGSHIPRGIAEVIETESQSAVPVSCWERIAERDWLGSMVREAK